MSEQEQNTENVEDLLDIENEVEANPKIELLIKFIAGIFLFVTILTVLICISLLVQSYLTHHIVYEQLIFDTFKINYGIDEFNYLCFKIIGCLLLVTIPLVNISLSGNSNLEFQKTKYILFFAGITFLFLYIILLIQTRHDASINSWSYFTEISLTFCLIPMSLASVSKKYEKLFQPFSWIILVIAITSLLSQS
ncbi:MAG: hypothetical protein ACRC80_21750 [Waterburya sp.]